MENVKIKKIPINDRPRERLIINGVSSLSNEELLSILLGTGTKSLSAKNLSSYILSNTKNISDLKKLSYHDLIKIKGIGKAKACTIMALIELSTRMNSSVDDFIGVKLNDVKKVFDYYRMRVSDNQEEFYCIYLDAKKRIIGEKLIFKGTVNHSLVHPRDIFKEAFKENATSIICMHNHPSGNVIPSKDDILVTNRLKEIGNLMGIKLIDHVIVSKGGYYSFLENGQI